MTMRRAMARFSAAGGLCLLAFAARAEVPANGQAYMEASVAGVESMVKVETGQAKLPRLADPVDGKVLEDVWNDAAILGKAPYSAADIPALLDIVQKQGRILQIYTLYSPAGKAADAAANAVEYQDELSRSRAFMMKAAAAGLEAINDFGARLSKDEKTESRFEGLRQMRLGMQEIIVGAALALRNPALREPNQTLIARGFADNAAAVVAGLASADRTALVTALQAVRPSLKPDAEKAVTAFIAVATSAPCDGLCQLQ